MAISLILREHQWKKRKRIMTEVVQEVEQALKPDSNYAMSVLEQLLYGLPLEVRRWQTAHCSLCSKAPVEVIYRANNFVLAQMYHPKSQVRPTRVYTMAPPLCFNCNQDWLFHRKQMVMEESWFFHHYGAQFWYELFCNNGQASDLADFYTRRVASTIISYLVSRVTYTFSRLQHCEFDYLRDLLLMSRS